MAMKTPKQLCGMEAAPLFAVLVAAVLCAAGSVAVLAQTTTGLQVTKSGNDVLLNMSVTSGPWHVVRSASPRFDYDNVLLADAAPSSPVSDANACLLPTLYFYDASDTGAGEVAADSGQPSQENLYLASLSPNSGWEGQSITIAGGGFSSEPTEDHVFFGPLPAVVTAATSTALTVTVPIGVTTGAGPSERAHEQRPYFLCNHREQRFRHLLPEHFLHRV
jgi:hypothetical protein